MSKKKLRYSLNQVIAAAEMVRCDALHHKAGHQHESDEVCKARYELDKHIHDVREHMKEQGL